MKEQSQGNEIYYTSYRNVHTCTAYAHTNTNTHYAFTHKQNDMNSKRKRHESDTNEYSFFCDLLLAICH